MRAGRLISMLVTLQRQGRTTAADLATELEVSVRTVLRDVATLSESGVPIYATPGAGGGIELLDGWRTRLTGLTPDEAAAVLLAGRTDLAALLGLGPAARSARAKLLLALPPSLAALATSLDDWLVDDPGNGAGAGAVLAAVTRAVHARVELELSDGGTPEVVRPLGLVNDAGTWRVVHLAAAGPAVRTLTVATRAGPFRRGFARPEGFALAPFWRAYREAGAVTGAAGAPGAAGAAGASEPRVPG